MKYFIITFLATILSVSFSVAQSDNEVYSYVEITPVDGVSAEELFNRAEAWLGTSFKKPENVIKLRNIETRQLILELSCQFTYSKYVGSSGANGIITYIVRINTRDNRYRLEIGEFYHKLDGGRDGFGFVMTDEKYNSKRKNKYNIEWEQSVYDEIRVKAAKEVANISITLKDEMRKKVEEW